MPTIEDSIKEVEAEIAKTQVNKHTEYHIGKLKAKIARLKDEQEKRRSTGGGGGKGYSVKKSGNATVALVGFPSVGKSTLLNRLTGAESEVGAYDFTTIDVVPGIMEYNSAKIQILDLPGLIRDASKGKGRGREVLSVVRSADLILFVLDTFDTNLHVLIRELETAGIRINTHPADVVITRTEFGGIEIKPTVTLTKIDVELATAVVSEYGFVNAEVVIREDVNVDQLIDVLTGNRVYSKGHPGHQQDRPDRQDPRGRGHGEVQELEAGADIRPGQDRHRGAEGTHLRIDRPDTHLPEEAGPGSGHERAAHHPQGRLHR